MVPRYGTLQAILIAQHITGRVVDPGLDNIGIVMESKMNKKLNFAPIQNVH